MSSRRSARSFLDELFEMLMLAPIWFGPIFAGIVFAGLYWGVPWLLLPRNPDDIMQRTVSQVIGGAAPRVAPYAAGVMLFVWLVAEGKKFFHRRELARLESRQHNDRTAPANSSPSQPDALERKKR